MSLETKIRYLDDPALDGPTNMARDEVLLNLVGEQVSPPTLRFYEWTAPVISLGYFQSYDVFARLPAPAGELPVVRRLTGGGAILHDRELTYSLTLPADHELVARQPRRLYDLMHEAVIHALGDLGVVAARCGTTDDSGPTRGPFFCFSRRHEADVLVDGEKIAGSAQRRTRSAILQHGSLILQNRYPQQVTSTVARSYEQTVIRLRKALLAHVGVMTGASFQRAQWTERELANVDELRAKYAGSPWTRRR